MSSPDPTMAQISRRMLSAKAEQFTESVIREMTRLALKHGAVNLSQGFPDFPAPEEIKEAARKAISDNINQYAITWGAKPLRDAIVEKFERTQGVKYDPEREVTICCGSTEAMMSAMMAIINPGDEVVVFEPFYENYGPDAILSGATPRFAKLRTPDWSFDEKNLPPRSDRTRKPSFSTRRITPPAKCSRARNWNSSATSACVGTRTASPMKFTSTFFTTARTHLHGADRGHARPHHRDQWALENVQRDRMARGLGAGPAEPTQPIRKVHDFLTVVRLLHCNKRAPARCAFRRTTTTSSLLPILQARTLAEDSHERRITVFKPRGAYYIMTDISLFADPDPVRFPAETKDVRFAKYLVEKSVSPSFPARAFTTTLATALRRYALLFARRKKLLRPPRNASRSFTPEHIDCPGRVSKLCARIRSRRFLCRCNYN